MNAENCPYFSIGNAGKAQRSEHMTQKPVIITRKTPRRQKIMKPSEINRAATDKYAAFIIAAAKSSSKYVVEKKDIRIAVESAAF